MEGDPLNAWLERFGGHCPICRGGIQAAPAGRCPSCQRRLILGLGVVQHNAAAWFAGLTVIAVSLTITLFPFLASVSVMVMDGNANELYFFVWTLVALIVFLAALVAWLKLHGLVCRIQTWIAWMLVIICAMPVLGALCVLLSFSI